MNEEIMENEIVETEDMETYEEPETVSKGHFGKIAVGAAVAVGLGVAALLYKNRDKLEKRRIEKLRKKGWIIEWPENSECDDDTCCVYEPEEGED